MLKALIMPAKSMISVRMKSAIPSTPFEMTRGSPRSSATSRTEGGYDPARLGAGVVAVIRGLADLDAPGR